MLIELWYSISPYILPLYYLLILGVVINILLENRNPLKTHSYLLLLLLLPILGIVIYLFFGQKFRKRKIFNKRRLINTAFGKDYAEKYLDKGSKTNVPGEVVPNNFRKLISFLSHDLSPISSSNHVEILHNGEEKFPKLISALQQAKTYIHIEYYIYSDDAIGREVANILMSKARQGIEVKLIVDAVGSFHLKRSFFHELEAAGVETQRFRPVLFPLFTSKFNYRDHRKIVVIDGQTGFTGGINLDSRYQNNGQHALFWRDTHLYIEGEAVKTLQLLFLLNWQFVNGENIDHPEKYFPNVKNEGNQLVQINASGPDWELASIMDSFFLAINSALRSIQIATPYFIPSESILDSLLTAAKSGIDVELMLPYRSDSFIVQAASTSFLARLLECGVKVFLYQKGFLHNKTMTVDDHFVSIGTANMDHRSFDINYEVNTYVYDEALTTEVKKQFEYDKLDCVQVDPEEWENRKLSLKLQESVCRLLAPLL